MWFSSLAGADKVGFLTSLVVINECMVPIDDNVLYSKIIKPSNAVGIVFRYFTSQCEQGALSFFCVKALRLVFEVTPGAYVCVFFLGEVNFSPLFIYQDERAIFEELDSERGHIRFRRKPSVVNIADNSAIRRVMMLAKKGFPVTGFMLAFMSQLELYVLRFVFAF